MNDIDRFARAVCVERCTYVLLMIPEGRLRIPRATRLHVSVDQQPCCELKVLASLTSFVELDKKREMHSCILSTSYIHERRR